MEARKKDLQEAILKLWPDRIDTFGTFCRYCKFFDRTEPTRCQYLLIPCTLKGGPCPYHTDPGCYRQHLPVKLQTVFPNLSRNKNL